MQIDLNSPDNLTLAAVRQMIAASSDDVHTQLRVTRGGIAYISSDAVAGVGIENLLFRLETWCAGSGCVGPMAASDATWVVQIYNALQQNWPTPSDVFIDVY